jgi:hypothetical protein
MCATIGIVLQTMTGESFGRTMLSIGEAQRPIYLSQLDRTCRML